MPNLFDEWQNSDVVIRIQDKNYPTEAAANYYTGYHNCGAFSKNLDYYYLEPIDTRVRIPAYYSRSKYITVIPDGFPVAASPQITGQRALGNTTTNPNRNAEIIRHFYSGVGIGDAGSAFVIHDGAGSNTTNLSQFCACHICVFPKLHEPRPERSIRHFFVGCHFVYLLWNDFHGHICLSNPHDWGGIRSKNDGRE